MTTQKITKAILPVAGFGTRFLPATKAQPKEMLPVVDKPVVQYIVEELVDAGIQDIIFITGRGKRAIEDHFDTSYELEELLEHKQKHDIVHSMRLISNLARFTYVRQKTPRGNGDAILQAAHLVGEGESAIVVFGDCLYDAKTSTTKQLLSAYKKYPGTIIGLTEVERNEVSKFGVVDGKMIDKQMMLISKFVEKPKMEEAPTNMVVPGKYILGPDVFRVLREMKKEEGEIGLDDAFNILLAQKKKLRGCVFEGEWLDTGDKFNFVKATIHLGLKHPEIGEKLREYLKGLKL